MMMEKVFAVVVALTTSAILAVATDPLKHTFKPEAGYVPDANTAVAIAVAVWNPIYGKETIEAERPYKAMLSNGVWTVVGTLPKRMVGGVVMAEISKDDGRILRVTHGK